MAAPPVAAQRASRLAPLPPLKVSEDATAPTGRRRMSNSWTENLDEGASSADIKSPLQKVAAFFSENKMVSPVAKDLKPQQKQERKSGERKEESKQTLGEVKEKQPKIARRESIKDHLLKFKQKAGKVLEEVQERFTEDHSAVAPLVPSPTRPSAENVDSDDPSGSERVVSPTLSVASKKTVSSAELKASLRSKIRKQAEKVVERTRGSVQLTRRLQRRLTVHAEETFSESDLKNVDEQIEKSIKLGEKFLSQQPPSVYPPEDEQLLFFTQTIPVEKPKNGAPAESKPRLIYSAAGPSPEEDSALFTIYEPDPNDVENRAVYPVSYRMRKRLPVSVWNDHLAMDAQLERKYKWISAVEDSYVYLPALRWEDQIAAEEKKTHMHMKVTIESVALVNHSLSTVEEGIAASLRHHYSEQQELLEKGAALLQRIEEVENEDKEQSIKDPKWFEKEMAKLHQQLQQGAENLRQQWNALEASRAAQGFSVTTLKYTPPSDETDLIGTVKEEPAAGAVPTTISPDTKEKLMAKTKHTFRLSLFFNEVLVGKTSWRPIGNYNLEFNQTFNMEIKSVPQKILAVLMEKEGGKEEQIASIEIPIPWKKNTDSGGKSSIPFQETNKNKESADKVRGFLVARVDWTPPEAKEKKKETENEEDEREKVAFSLIPSQCRLVSDEEFEGNLRWEVLEKRFKRKLPKSVDARRIGIDSSEIDPSLVVGEERNTISHGGFRTGIDGHRIAGASFASRIRTKILEQRSEAENQVSYEELVREVPLPSGVGMFGSLFGPADESRKLKPMRVETKRQQTTVQTGSRILVNVQSASNLPIRKDNSLQPFIEKEAARSTVVAGRHPNWQQCLLLPLDVENTPDLKTVIDHLHIDVYDQVVSPLPRDDREPNSVHEQLLRRLIGTVRIPFSTIYCRGRIDGGFRVQTPLFITGYNIPDKPSYIKILVAIEPTVVAPRPTPSLQIDTNETEKIISQCESWVKTCREQFPDRRFTAIVNDINGKQVLVSRFLRPIRCPPSLEPLSGRKSIDLAAKVVSYMPFLSDPLFFPGIVDLWTTLDQFVSFGCGDEEEHALLLCCWLLGNRIPSYLILGSAIPEGEKAAFVMTELPEITLLINPSDGNLYSLDDPMCPVVSVGTVVTETNVYANVQPRAHPSQMNFDFSKSNEWLPLFAKPLENLQSVQPSGVSYQEVTEDAIVELRSSIEREVKIRFDEQRQFAIPQWNLMASRLLREMLNEDSFTQNTVDERFGRLRESYNVHAMAVKVPYRSLQKCVEDVLEMGLHVNTDTNLQFALGVHVQPFFNSIVSCSLAVAVLSQKK